MIDPSLLGFRGLGEVLNVHPVFVHFPIALLPSALLLYGLGVIMRRSALMVAGRACLYLAAAGTMVTVITGLMAEASVPHNEQIHHLMQTHKHIGYLIGILVIVLVGWSFAHREQRPRAAEGFLALLAVSSLLVLQNGDLGGRMVFVEGAAVKPAIPLVIEGHEHHEEKATPPKAQKNDAHGHEEHDHAH